MSHTARAPREAGASTATLTLLELMVLIAGIALVLALPWGPELWLLQHSPWYDHEFPWNWESELVVEAIGKTCLAFVPVLLLRRRRLGGLLEPSSFLMACCGLPWAVRPMELWLDKIGQAYQEPPNQKYEMPFRIAAMLIAGLAVASFALFRRLPNWLRSMLLMLAWLGLYVGANLVCRYLAGLLIIEVKPPEDFPEHGPMDFADERVWSLFGAAYCGTLYAIPLLMTMRRSRPEINSPRGWLGWIPILVASAYLLINDTSSFANDYFESTTPYFRAIWVGQAGGTIVAVLLSYLLVRRFRAAWSRPPPVGYDGSRTPTPPLEV